MRAAEQTSPQGAAGRIELRSVIAVAGLTMANPGSLTGLIMQEVSKVVGIPMRRCEMSSDMKPHDWTEAKNLKGEWNGPLLAESQTPEDVLALFLKIHGCAIEANGMSYPLEVDNVHSNLDASSVQNLQLQRAQSSAPRPQQE